MKPIAFLLSLGAATAVLLSACATSGNSSTRSNGGIPIFAPPGGGYNSAPC